MRAYGSGIRRERVTSGRSDRLEAVDCAVKRRALRKRARRLERAELEERASEAV